MSISKKSERKLSITRKLVESLNLRKSKFDDSSFQFCSQSERTEILQVVQSMRPIGVKPPFYCFRKLIEFSERKFWYRLTIVIEITCELHRFCYNKYISKITTITHYGLRKTWDAGNYN